MTNNDDSTTIAYQMMFLAKGKLPPWLLLAAVLHSPNAMAHSIVPADGVTAIAVASEQNDGLRGDRYLVSVMPIYADLTFIPKYQEVPPDKRGRAHIEILSFTMSMRRDSEDVEMEKFDLLNMAFFQPDYQIGGILPKTNSIKLVLGHVRRETAKGSVIDAARLNIG